MREYFYFLRLMRKELYGALLGIFMSFVASFASVALMGTATWFLSAMAIAGFYDYALNIFIPSALIRLLALARTLLRYLERYYTHDATFKILAYLRVFLFERALELKLEEALQLRSADLQRRMQADVERLEMIYVRQVAPVICAILMGILVGGVLISYSVTMALTALGLMVLAGVVVPAFLTKLGYAASQAQSTLAIELNNQASVLLHGFFDLVLLGSHGYVAAKFLEHSQKLAKVRARLTYYEQLAQVALLTCAELTLVLLLIEGTPLIITAALSPAQLMLFAVSAMAAFEVLVPLAAACLNLPYVMQSAKRVSELLNITAQNSELNNLAVLKQAEPVVNKNYYKPADQAAAQADAAKIRAFTQANSSSQVSATTTTTQPAQPDQLTHSVQLTQQSRRPEVKVRLEHVGFAYTLTPTQVVTDLNLELSNHKNYLLKAPSGRGKSTLVLLLTGLLFPQQGKISLEAQGKNLYYTNLPKRDIREHFAVAMQDITFFTGTIREIFTQVQANAKTDDILNVLDEVELRELMCELPDGLDTWIGSTGVSLSGGQLRRLGVARALLKARLDPKVDFLILDEPGEGLDETQEMRIIERIQSSRKGVLIITHKSAGAKLSDELIRL